MKKYIIIALCAVLGAVGAFASSPVVKPGIEVLRDRGFDVLKGKRVGLITNPTGVDNSLKSTIDILHESPDVELVALFAPEHGVRGDVVAGAKVATSTDAKTGVKVYSLYGSTRRPTAEMLRDIDVLVYDIQDIGCRSYTFISTMGLAMEQCAALGKEFVVLDRPDPLGGCKVEGPSVDGDCISFVSQFPVPYIYGLTPGELAGLLVGEGMVKQTKPLNLTVVPMEGWSRDMLFSDTGMPWVLPSPHIPSPETAIYYPASGIAGELNYLSIGVGYTLPFRTFAAPWIDGGKLASRLNSLELPGLLFRPITYKPFYSFDSGKSVGGVEMYVTDFEAAPLSLAQFYVMQELAALYPDKKVSVAGDPKRFSMFDKVVGTKKVRTEFFKRHRVDDILPLWNGYARDFRETKKSYHLYE